ncbi:class I mannose-6-phosphate isomerase [Sphingobium nicotianae]|uniref:Class I mannose-6-phosphate isomerase n=1 Tax=Sphingobium nicotianae TaxID=2782607 RepID=A0A9X1D9G8_9SPHN|nr:class I mannose-6-phosphate isomerase [Sphingobium nicotianae]MBT2185883.1 class I mannose-6-phosphate isomerase [Sphingobium nicotianae]
MTATRLHTKYVEKPWGRHTLPGFFPEGGGRQIGEVWFDGPDGRHPPILVKYIFTSERLSIQVHPDDAQGRARGLPGGKSECWFILDAEPDATLGMGTVRPLSGDELRAASLDGEIEQLMDWKPVRPGDFFYIPAGTVHAIGAGVTLVEVQQNVDVTYRLYDYGRPRELHLDDGVAVSRPEPYERAPVNVAAQDEAALLDRSEAPFNLTLDTFPEGTHSIAGSGPCWFIPLTGHGTVDGAPWQAGQCWLIDGTARLLVAAKTRALLATV